MDGLGSTLLAVSDPTRRAIIDRLRQGPMRMTDLAQPFPMSLNAVSKHVKVLEKSGLVTRTRHGREHSLALDVRPLHDIASWAHQYFRYWDARLDRSDAWFARQENTP